VECDDVAIGQEDERKDDRGCNRTTSQ